MRPVSALAALAFVLASTPVLQAHGGVTSYCQSGATGARIAVSGSASFTANGGSGDLVLHASNLPVNATGTFLLGGGATQGIPFGQGFRCMAPIFRMGAANAGPGQTSVSRKVDYLSGGVASMITPGSTWYFQFWFRAAPSFDLTDAVQVAFVPPAPLVPATSLERGTHSFHPLAQEPFGGIEIVSDPSAWNGFWFQHHSNLIPPPPVPFVDFTQNMVVAVFAGQRSSGGHDLIVRKLDLSVTTLDVTTLENTPGANCPVTAVITNPYHLVIVPRVERMTVGTWTRGLFHAPPCP